MKHHDLIVIVIVIGTGSGNSVIDSSMADWDIGLIDQRRAGGTCLNYGCIPTKMFTVTDEAGNRNQLTGDRIQAFVMAIEFGISATDLARRPHWIHPALTEIVQNALLDVSAAA